jgi:hypothetical protein
MEWSYSFVPPAVFVKIVGRLTAAEIQPCVIPLAGIVLTQPPDKPLNTKKPALFRARTLTEVLREIFVVPALRDEKRQAILKLKGEASAERRKMTLKVVMLYSNYDYSTVGPERGSEYEG